MLCCLFRVEEIETPKLQSCTVSKCTISKAAINTLRYLQTKLDADDKEENVFIRGLLRFINIILDEQGKKRSQRK